MKIALGLAFVPLLLADTDTGPLPIPNAFISQFIPFIVSNFLPFLFNPTITNNNEYLPEDFLLTDTLIKNKGYGYEQHEVTTEDGYILSLHRIISPVANDNENRPPVYLQHGILASSDVWLSNPNASLAFSLAEHGYDVWLGDQRGSAYSKNHEYYSVEDPRYWNFTFHECGIYDLPAFIDYILKTTGKPQLFYIGHSMGTTVFLTMASMKPEYNDKVKAAILLAPIATTPTLSELYHPSIRLAILYGDAIKDSFIQSDTYEVLPRTGETIKAIRNNCQRDSPLQDFCLDIIGIGFGEDRENFDRNTIGQVASYLPSGGSIYTLHHFSQIYKTGFRLYSRGWLTSNQIYGSDMPPFYALENITTPVALMYGDNDTLMNRRSAKELASKLQNLLMNKMIKDPKFTHADFVFGTNAKEMLIDEVVSLLESLL